MRLKAGYVRNSIKMINCEPNWSEKREKIQLSISVMRELTYYRSFRYLEELREWEIYGKTVETVSDFIFWGSKITADGDCSHEIKSSLLLGRKVMTNLSSVQLSRSVVSDSMQPHELEHTRPPWSSPTPGVHSDSRPLSQWCHPAILSSVVPFSSCPQSLPAWESFPMSQLFTWGGQSIGVSALASFLPMNT